MLKSGICEICKKESNDLWLLNLAKIDSLEVVEGKNIRQSICQECVSEINQAVNSLENGTSMSRALEKAGVRPNNNMNNRNLNNRNINNSRGQTQNHFLDSMIKEGKLVQVEAVEGIGWRGYIKKYDDFSILITSEQSEEEELLFKHAVKSIKPI